MAHWLDAEAHVTDTLVLRAAVAVLVNGDPVPVEHDQVRWLARDDLEAVDWLTPDRPFLPQIAAALGAT